MNKSTLTKKIALLPSKALREWMLKNIEKITDVDYGSGYTSDTGMAYDVLIAPGFARPDEYAFHTIVEPRAADVLSLLRNLETCDCEICKRRLLDPQS